MYNFALLADGRVCKWKNTDPDRRINVIDCESVIAVQQNSNKDIFLLMTSNYHFLLCDDGSEPEDISDLVYKAIRIRAVDAANVIEEFAIAWSTVAVRTDKQVGVVTLREVWRRSKTNPVTTFAFKASIDLFSYHGRCGFVRTVRNKLYLIQGYQKGRTKIPDNILACDPIEIMFPDPENIREIICTGLYALFLMQDGSVYSCDFTDTTWYTLKSIEAFVRVEIPKGECVTKIVNYGLGSVYITHEGRCYYSDSDSYVHPRLFGSLIGRFVTDVYIYMFVFVIRYDDGKLCCLPLYPRNALGKKCKHTDLIRTFVNGSAQPVDLPFFDDKDIVSAVETDKSVHFVTSDGQVYQSAGEIFTKDCAITEIPFFIENPVAVTRADHTRMIPSAQSVLD